MVRIMYKEKNDDPFSIYFFSQVKVGMCRQTYSSESCLFSYRKEDLGQHHHILLTTFLSSDYMNKQMRTDLNLDVTSSSLLQYIELCTNKWCKSQTDWGYGHFWRAVLHRWIVFYFLFTVSNFPPHAWKTEKPDNLVCFPSTVFFFSSPPPPTVQWW